MRTSSMLTRQVSGGRGVSGAHKLIPMPLRILRAPGRPALICVGQSTVARMVVLVFPGGHGVSGARKLIPMPLRISRAPGRPTLICVRQSTIGRMPSLNPQASDRKPFFPRKRPSVGDDVEAGDLSDVVFVAYAGQGGGRGV